MKFNLRVLAAAAALAVAGVAHAQSYPGISLSFVQPTGTALGSDTIDVWLRVSLDAGADPFNFDGSSAATLFNMQPDLLPISGYDYQTQKTSDFVTYDSAITNTAFACSGTFTNVCDPGAYKFNFHTTATPGKPTFNFLNSFSLAPGGSSDFLFGTFTPVGGAAPGGLYTFETAFIAIQVTGTDIDGNTIYGSFDLAATARGANFTRQVTAVPEPETYAMLLAGLGVLGFVARRRAKAIER